MQARAPASRSKKITAQECRDFAGRSSEVKKTLEPCGFLHCRRKSISRAQDFVRNTRGRDAMHRRHLSNVAHARCRRSLFLNEIRSFSLSAVVIGARCMSNSDVHRSDIATHSLLGGQHGEESEESEEGQEGKEEEGEEVPSFWNDAFDACCRRRVAKAGEAEGRQRNAAPGGHAGPGRRRRASAKPRSSLTGLPVGSTARLDRVRVIVRASRRACHCQERSVETISVFRRRPRS